MGSKQFERAIGSMRRLDIAMVRSPVRRSERTMVRLRMHARLAATPLAILTLISPTALRGQGLDRGASTSSSGPFEMVGRAGISALTLSRAAFVPSAGSTELAQSDTTHHHGSRAHHAAVGALIGGGIGLALGMVGDGMWFGHKPERSHFQNLWHYTVPLGALIGAFAGTLRQAD